MAQGLKKVKVSGGYGKAPTKRLCWKRPPLDGDSNPMLPPCDRAAGHGGDCVWKLQPKPAQAPDQGLTGTLSLLNSLIGYIRQIRDERTDAGRMHASAPAERLVDEIKKRIVEASA